MATSVVPDKGVLTKQACLVKCSRVQSLHIVSLSNNVIKSELRLYLITFLWNSPIALPKSSGKLTPLGLPHPHWELESEGAFSGCLQLISYIP